MNSFVVEEKIVWMYLLKKINKILVDLGYVPREIKIDTTADKKREHKKIHFFLCGKKFNPTARYFKRSEIILITEENIGALPIHYVI